MKYMLKIFRTAKKVRFDNDPKTDLVLVIFTNMATTRIQILAKAIDRRLKLLKIILTPMVTSS